ncbi:UNVERIFIED_CONTAM: hypothetical protein FKN15_035097 [Acipenser sinensis]
MMLLNDAKLIVHILPPPPPSILQSDSLSQRLPLTSFALLSEHKDGKIALNAFVRMGSVCI